MKAENRAAKRELVCFFSSHPYVQFYYFFLVLFTGMFVVHPVLTGISLLGVLTVLGYLHGMRKVMWRYVCGMLPVLCVIIAVNTAFNHYGVTVLFYVKTGAVTLESVVYGVVLAAVLWTLFLWFCLFNRVITTDKIIFLFGRRMPKLALALSMVLGFVPKLLHYYQQMLDAQKAIAINREEETLGKVCFPIKQWHHFWKKVKKTVKQFSMLVTWALQSAVETADSMKSRGYATAKRTSYRIFCFTRQDALWMLCLSVLYSMVLWGIINGKAEAEYNPVIHIAGLPLCPYSAILYGAWGLCCFFPLWQEVFSGRNGGKS